VARKPLPSVAPTGHIAPDRGRRPRRFLLAGFAAALALSLSGCVIFKSVSSSQLNTVGNVQITTTACASDTSSNHTGYSPTDSACQGSTHGGNAGAPSIDATTTTPTLHHVTTGLKTDTTTNDPSFSFAVNSSGADHLLVVKIGENSATDNIAGVTYGGTALTALTEYVPGASRFVDHVFYLKNPTVGTANVVVDITAGVKLTVAMEQYNGVNQTTPFGTVATNSNTGSTGPTVNVSSTSGDLVTDSLVVVSNSPIPTDTATSPQNKDYEINTGSTTTDIVGVGSHKTAAGTTSTMAHTLSASRAWSTVGFAIKGSQNGMQLKLAYRIPTAITAPSTIVSTDPSGGSAITFTQDSGYSSQLTSLSAPGSGKKWVGYLSDFQSYTTAGYQYFTVAPQFALPQGSDGAPFQGPFNYRVVVGYRGVDQTTTGSTSSRAVTCGADAFASYSDGASSAGQTGICIDDPSSSTVASDLSQTTRDLGVVAGSPQSAQAGDPATVPFTLKYRGSSSPSFNLSGSSNLPGSPTVTPSQSSFTPGTDEDKAVTASVTVPPTTTPGTYNVTFTATGTGGAAGQNRSNTNTIIVGEAFGFSPSPALPSLGSITLNAQAQTQNGTMSNLGVIDSPGSSDAGWNVTAVGDNTSGNSPVLKQYCPNATCGSDTGGPGFIGAGYALSANSLTVDTSSGSWSGGTGSAPSFNCNAGGCAIDAAPGSPTKIASAPNGGGTALWSATGFNSSSLTLSTPSTLRALQTNEVYKLNIAWSLNSGP
jgi:hypothetical protein